MRKHDRYRDNESQRYEDPIASRESIFELVASQKGLSHNQIREKLSIQAHQDEALVKRLAAMVRAVSPWALLALMFNPKVLPEPWVMS